MKKYILGAALLFVALITPLAPAQAAGLTSTQVQTILGLLTAFNVDSATIANVNAALTGSAPATGAATTGGTTTTSGDQSFCHTFNNNLTIGSSGDDISALNGALMRSHIEPSGNTFDVGHVAGVVVFQKKYNIPQTGYVGPITREKLNSLYGCSNQATQQTTSTVVSDSANNTFLNNLYQTELGRAPDASGMSYYMDKLTTKDPARSMTQAQVTASVHNSSEAITYRASHSTTTTTTTSAAPHITNVQSLDGNITITGGIFTVPSMVSLNGKTLAEYPPSVRGIAGVDTITFKASDFGVTASGSYPVQIIDSSLGNSNVVYLNYSAPASAAIIPATPTAYYVDASGNTLTAATITSGNPLPAMGYRSTNASYCDVYDTTTNSAGVLSWGHAPTSWSSDSTTYSASFSRKLICYNSAGTASAPAYFTLTVTQPATATVPAPAAPVVTVAPPGTPYYTPSSAQITMIGTSGVYIPNIRYDAPGASYCDVYDNNTGALSWGHAPATWSTTNMGPFTEGFSRKLICYNSANVASAPAYFTLTVVSPTVAGCSALTGSPTWGGESWNPGSVRGCSAPVNLPWTPVGQSVSNISNTTSGYLGTATETCFSYGWGISASSCISTSPTASWSTPSITVPYNGYISSVSFSSSNTTGGYCDVYDTTSGTAVLAWGHAPTTWSTTNLGPNTASYSRKLICYNATGTASAPAYFSLTVLPASTGSALDALNSAKSSTGTSRVADQGAGSFHYAWNRDLQVGSSHSADVTALQTALAKEGVYAGEAVGEFHDQTYIAVKKFQKKHGIKASGYVGQITRTKLNTLYSE